MTTLPPIKRGRGRPPKSLHMSEESAKPQPSEQRLSPRKNFKTRIVFEDEFGDDFLYFVSQNISTSGVFIETSLDLKPGMRVFIKFSLYEGHPPIRVAGEVMRQFRQKRGPGRHKPLTPGVGIRFIGLTGAEFEMIRRFVG